MAVKDTSPVEEARMDELNVETVDDQLDDIHSTGAAHDKAMDMEEPYSLIEDAVSDEPQPSGLSSFSTNFRPPGLKPTSGWLSVTLRQLSRRRLPRSCLKLECGGAHSTGDRSSGATSRNLAY
jgi:hypothetical protein